MSSMATFHQVLPVLVDYVLSFFYISSLATVPKVLTFYTGWVFPELLLWAPCLHSKCILSVLNEYLLSFFYEFPCYFTPSIFWASSMSSLVTLHHVLTFCTAVDYFLSSLYEVYGYIYQVILHWLRIFWAPSISSLPTVDKLLNFWVFPELHLGAPWLTLNQVLTSCTGWVFPELPLRTPWLQYMIYLLPALVEYEYFLSYL